MKNEKFTIVDKIGEDNVIAFRNKTSVALDTSGEKLSFSDFTYSFDEILSVARKIEQLKANENIGSTVESV